LFTSSLHAFAESAANLGQRGMGDRRFRKRRRHDHGAVGRHIASGTSWTGIDGPGAGMVGAAWRIPDVDYAGLAVVGWNVCVCSAGSALGVL